MPNSTIMANISVLDREMFSEAEAARLLLLAQGTLHYWLEGGERRGRSYKPVIRVEPTGMRAVTWAEFVEAALLREYRRTHGVPMAELRTFIDELRQGFGVPYPLAHHQPFVSGRQLILAAQEHAGLGPEFCLVAVASNQLILTPPSQSFVERVVWHDDLAAGWHPHQDLRSPVVMAPDLRFGRPAVKGISTEVLWEHAEAGEDLTEVAGAFDLSVEDVRWALAYETSARAA
jgi:uncharacterized protein (DUF433 family)